MTALTGDITTYNPTNMPITKKVVVTNQETGAKEEVVLQEISRTVLTQENLAETILKKYITDKTTVDDILMELKGNNII